MTDVAEALRGWALDTPQAGGLTMQELLVQTGHSEKWVRARLREYQRQGRLVTNRRHAKNLTGAQCWVPVYSLTDQAGPGVGIQS